MEARHIAWWDVFFRMKRTWRLGASRGEKEQDEQGGRQSQERFRPGTAASCAHADRNHGADEPWRRIAPYRAGGISATGVLLRRPLGWHGEQGQSWILDMIFGHDLHIHLEAQVARISERHLGFAYTHIPEDKQVPLWNLLGGYADILEMWHD